MSFDRIIAQPSAVRTLSRSVTGERVASAYLFEGPTGVGKQLAATELARALVCAQRPRVCEGTCDMCRRLLAGTHPDFRVFGPRDEGNRNIQVEVLRGEILPIAQFAPFEAPAAMLLFPDADVSFPPNHPEAANALLKTLEEPRERVHFVLLSSRPERLLPTIRSRCQSVRFHRLPPSVIERILSEHGVLEDHWPLAVALADGRADVALELAASGTAEQVLGAAMRVDAAVTSGGPGALVTLAEELARDDGLERALLALATFYRDVAACSLGADPHRLVLRHQVEAVEQRAATLSAADAAARVELLHRTIDSFERNANRQLALDALLFELRLGAA